ncbi:ABC transporter ATP-binding protein [Archaeoglobus profundus]|uniref:ABC transporter related protein n=1 Tax=Archaeoglobus profundus (strain DSM 5631 / JCM 9629 / NBRC 100127 / Av18) TaxID=572546 RepID=D2RD79_ARCPA|nr:ABC transporter ATP-binding protein [Archaeoglobus profundus]ADB58073.1 ABC transporter related protein [Archaeoglobus profundus DSM 5631]
MVVSVKNVSFSYGGFQVLRDVTMNAREGEIVCLLGPNGAGKSTLLRCTLGALRPQKGRIIINGVDIFDFDPIELAKLIGYVPQAIERTFPLTVFESVLIGRLPYLGWTPSQSDIEAVRNAMKLLGIENLAWKNLNELSGGQRQKVLLAMALAKEPSILLLDEPTNNLDLNSQLEVMDIIRDVVKDGKTAIVALHDLNLALRYADKIVIMKNGRVLANGKPAEVLSENVIESVYGVKAIVKNENGLRYVIPLTRCEHA